MPIRNPPATTPSDKPTVAIAQTMPRVTPLGSLVLTSGVLTLTAIYLPAGPVASVTFQNGSTALATGTHAWGALYNSSLGLLAQSTDDVAPAWAAGALKTFTFTAPVTVATAGWYYVGIMVVASTMPNPVGINPTTAVGNLAPASRGNSTTGLAATAPNPCASPSGGTGAFYAYVS